uniref:AAA+ ATPase domain-containing protein n=1 Tax=Aureoumbra lagunensis TaxID=44058 RepID=A0A7S3JV70_9STRA|mmetsp:Transcript_8120/g.11310  ORF Transcript_8120/g.11310 Transcript_8120/m.11310 type:complete len:602 (-) Transcript_8120:300-2105(-)
MVLLSALDNELEVKTYHVEDEEDEEKSNTTSSVIKIYNEMDNDDAASLIAFFIFLFLILMIALCIYYGSGLRLWYRQTFWFPFRRLCCEGEQRRLWELHKKAVIRGDESRRNIEEQQLLARDESESVSSNPAHFRVELVATTDQDTGSSNSIQDIDDDPLEAQLDMLVGLEPLKEEIRALRRSLVVEQQRRRILLGTDNKNRRNNKPRSNNVIRGHAPHFIFRGSPGTGKTLCARLLSRLLKELGYVHGDIVEVQRADLVAGYVGQTALKTRAVINRAKGGVLFIDEAYSLAPRGAGGAGRDFGAEAVQEIMRDLTSGDPVVILAGYPREMEHFLRVNPGLSRRFQVRFAFPDYSTEQLAAIFVKIAARHGYRLSRDASPTAIKNLIDSHFDARLCVKWNGGLPEGLFKRAKDALARRLNVLTMSADAALTLTLDDIAIGARILKSTLGDEGPISSQQFPTTGNNILEMMSSVPNNQEEEDDDDDMYGDDDNDVTTNLLHVSNQQNATRGNTPLPRGGGGIEGLLANLLRPDNQTALASLNTLLPRVSALESTVSRLEKSASSTDAPSSFNNSATTTNTNSSGGDDDRTAIHHNNPWEHVV